MAVRLVLVPNVVDPSADMRAPTGASMRAWAAPEESAMPTKTMTTARLEMVRDRLIVSANG
jgi:hypothetical protein